GGGGKSRSGWSFDQKNFQSGYSRVIDGSGGDTLNEGIFHSQGRTFTIQTVQYDVWSWDYSKHLGHCPPDSLMGVNFTVFGRVDSTHWADVKRTPIEGTNASKVIVDQRKSFLEISFYIPKPSEHVRLDFYDILGRR